MRSFFGSQILQILKCTSKSIWPIIVLASIFYVYLCCVGLFNGNINIWDEAIYANNAVEMYFNGDMLVLHNDEKPSYYNIKPPFVIWLQAFSTSIFGISEFSIRLPSALAGIGIGLLLLWYSVRILHDLRIGILSLLILAGCSGYFRSHVIWSGDLDAVLVFFTTAYSLLVFSLLFKDRSSLWYYIGIAVCSFLAYFSKSIAGWIPILGLFLGVALDYNGKKILSKPSIYVVAFMSLFLVVGYYFVRGFDDPVYLEAFYNSELKRFTHNVAPWLNGPWYYYIKGFFVRGFLMPFAVFLPLALFAVKKMERR